LFTIYGATRNWVKSAAQGLMNKPFGRDIAEIWDVLEALAVLGVMTVGYVVATIVVPGLILAYPVARTYVVVKYFRILAHSPAEIYKQPVWATYIPHLVAA
jgi:branched-subunit amino acid permease